MLDDDAVRALARQCRDRTAVLMDAHAGQGAERWLVKHGAVVLAIAYSRTRDFVISVVPPQRDERAKHKARKWHGVGR